MNAPKIVVIGSINMDLVTSSPRFPQPGETLLGTGFNQYMGGKGANQAVAAARLGAHVSLIGAVGADHFGQVLLDNLKKERVNTDAVRIIQDQPSGLANITVAEGDNHIVVVSGANFSLTPSDVEQEEQRIASADVVMAQLETPLDTVIASAKLAKKHGKPFILNPAPAQKLPQELVALTGLLTPNAYELAISLGLSENLTPEEMLQQSPCQVVMTLGSKGALFTDESGAQHRQPSFKVTPVDTTGAGDTFNGALAVFLNQGLHEAVKKACAAAALSVTRPGAQSGMPVYKELAAFLKQAV
ncbi:ribokinase [Neisseria canis]|uniref:Ribokinase n=1 Tax=Neisseria canis TaxID=493 RepID=A0A1X3CXW1_9NEIS|nr:ribokinase [Neisseria canis]OSI12468.1 ribokinase [Neisseria canis]VEF02789.1 Ribokinase [Neisseria canis]